MCITNFMTPSKLLKLNIKNYKYLILTIILSLGVGYFLSSHYSLKIINKYEVVIVEDINTKYIIDQIYRRSDASDSQNNYSKYLKNYIVSEFINSEFNQNAELLIDKKENYSIMKTFSNLQIKKIKSFEDNLNKFLKKSEIFINKEISNNFGKNITANSKLFFKKHSNKKGSKPSTIYFVTLIMGIVIMNFIIILDNPPRK